MQSGTYHILHVAFKKNRLGRCQGFIRKQYIYILNRKKKKMQIDVWSPKKYDVIY